MTREEGRSIVNGLYFIYWKTGGHSVAAVGRNEYGDTWFAPTNWLTVPSYYWKLVDRVTLILVDQDVEEYDATADSPVCQTVRGKP